MRVWREIIRRFSNGFILAFHEIPPARLAEFVDSLAPAQPVHLDEMVKRIGRRKSTHGLFAITVDDGVGDNVRSLAELFVKRQWPATFYLPTLYLDSGQGMAFQWWRRVVPRLPRRKLELNAGSLDFSHPRAVEDTVKRMERSWHSQPLELYFPLIQELVDLATREGVPRAELQPDAPITWEEACRLSRSDLIRFESHGVTHTAMSALPDEYLAFEMRHSRDLVSERCGRPCRHIAYPFGSPLSIGARASAMARRFYDSAVTMSSGAAGEGSNPWLLPRIPLYATNSNLAAWVKTRLRYSRDGLTN